MKDDLGKRMKEQYEMRTRSYLPRRTYSIIRIDGKAFHTFTKGMERPYDSKLMDLMDQTTKELCSNIQGARLGYVQSDEISILMTDFDEINTDAWFNGQVQKIVSVSASIATRIFNQHYVSAKTVYSSGILKLKLAEFDSRVFCIPDRIEVENYFIWRQKDAVRNSIQMTAQSLYSHKELMGKSSNEQQEMIFQKGTNWNDMPDGFKRGRIIQKGILKNIDTDRIYNGWIIQPAFDFIKSRDLFQPIIPNYPN
jgi:tRNA(His) guanylyltransferase